MFENPPHEADNTTPISAPGVYNITELRLQFTAATAKEYSSLPTQCGGTLGYFAYDTPHKSGVMHLFSIFLLAVASEMDPAGGETVLVEGTTSREAGDFSIKLQNSTLSELANVVHQTSLCSQEEAHLAIVAALSLRGKLPKVDVLLK